MEAIFAPVIDLESGKIHVADRQDVQTALNLARIAFIISNTVVIFYMAMIQYLLFQVRFTNRTRKTKIRPPTFTDNLVAVVTLWIIHRLLHFSISAVMDTTVHSAWNQDVDFHYEMLRYGRSFDIGTWVLIPVEWSFRSNAHFIFWEIVVTGVLYTLFDLNFVFTPILVELTHSPLRVLERMRRRSNELVIFMKTLFQERVSIAQLFSAPSLHLEDEKKVEETGKAIRLVKQSDELGADEQGLTSWDLRVDKDTISHLMEILGPPGGFGELGFSITAGKVCFEANGVGSRFNLSFVLGEDGEGGQLKKKR